MYIIIIIVVVEAESIYQTFCNYAWFACKFSVNFTNAKTHCRKKHKKLINSKQRAGRSAYQHTESS